MSLDGRTTAMLARLVAVLESTEGELVLTRDEGRWVLTVVVGGSAVAVEERGAATGRGSLFAALSNLERALAGMDTSPASRARLGSPFAATGWPA